MIRIKFIIFFVLTWALAHPPVAGAECHYDRNVELIGIVYNTATGYRTENDGITLADTAVFRKPYVMFGELMAHHPAVIVMKQMLEENTLYENQYFELGLCFDELDFTKPGGRFRLPDEATIPIVRCFLNALDDLAHEDYIKRYFDDVWPADICLIEERSKHLALVIEKYDKQIPAFMHEPAGFRTMIVPTIHLEPYVGYGALMTLHSGDRVAVSIFGLSLAQDDVQTVFNLAPGMFAHETLHSYVTQAMDSPEHKEQAQILQNIFPRFEAAAVATGDYSDWRSYFNETITMATEMTMNSYIGRDKEDFMLLKPAIEILKREFVGSQRSFFDFYPTLIVKLAFVSTEQI